MIRLIFLVVYFWGISFGFSQTAKVDSLRSLLPTVTDIQKIEVLQALVVQLWLNHPDTAIQYAREAYRISVAIEDVRSQAISVRLIGGVQVYLGAYDSALYMNKWAHALSVQVKDSTLISSTLNNIGFAYYHLGSYGEALEYLLRSISVKNKIRQVYGMGQTLNNVGLVYSKLKDYSSARKYFNQALEVGNRTKDGNIKLYSTNNIGFTYLSQGNFSVAEDAFKESLEIAKTVSNTNWHATAYSGLGQVYYRKGLLDRARRQFKISLRLRNEINDRKGISEIYYYLSKMYESSGYLDSAFLNLRTSQQIAVQIQSKERLLENYDFFKELYIKNRQYDSALYYQSKFVELGDNLFNENLARNLANIEIKIREEETIQRLADKDIQIQRRTLQTRFLVAISILIFLFALFIFRYYREQKRLGQDLTRKNQEILSQKEEIESQKEALILNNHELERAQVIIKVQNQELEQLNSKLQSTVDVRTKELELANTELRVANLELDNFIYKSSHDIKGPLVRLLGICHVALLDIKDENAREYFHRLNKTAKHINDIFDRLKIVSNLNSTEVTYERIDFTKIYDHVHSSVHVLDGFESIQFKTEIEEGIEFYSDVFLIETIFHNMVENAIKFQNDSERENKFIKIGVKQSNDNVVVSFVDNGIGIRESDIDHIFKMFSQAALEHQTVGLGLYIVKQCVGKLKGTINLLRSQRRLTEFEVVLPILSPIKDS